MSRTVIRAATLRDVDALVDLGRAMHAASRYAVYEYDAARAAAFARDFALDGRRTACIVSEQDGTISGMIAGEISSLMFSSLKVATDVIFYVAPERRGSTDALRLVRALLQWAKDQGAVEASFATSTGVEVTRTARLYGRFGFRRVGAVFTMPL
ncbi:MAG: GNAT family N-acetyltransferase [Pseudomonadota bacterium]